VSIRAIDLYHIDVPLKKPVRHASHAREASDNLVVRVTLGSGEVGFGEGVPRAYVTGETVASTFGTLANFDAPSAIGDPRDFNAVCERLWAWMPDETRNDPRGMAGNAARCALELAVLDAYGQKLGESIGAVVPWAMQRLGCAVPASADHPARVRYGGAITADSERKEWISASKMRLYGFAQVKVKVGVNGQDDAKRLNRLRWILGRRMDLRIDANEAWSADELVDRVQPLLRYNISALEQPLPVAQDDRLAEWRPRLGVPVMLDESLCGIPDAQRAIDRGLADILNVRLSKCGGIMPSMRIWAMAERAGLRAQLGCHPGETGILSAAGRHVASRVGNFRYLEGSYDRHILKRNLTVEDPTFRYGGWAQPIEGPGLGVRVNPEALEAMTLQHRELRYG
jgi:muconate cycloisomerase